MRIAVLDMLFNWPPDGGARVDVREIFSRLARTHEVRLFAPEIDLVLHRGRITEDPGFHVTTIPFSRRTFTRWGVQRKFRKALDAFRPDIVFVTDGWHMKPWAAKAAKNYPVVIRFYAYECMCLRQHGLFLRGDRPCYRSHLGPFFPDFFICNACALKFLLRNRIRNSNEFLDEYLAAGVCLPTYPAAVKQMLGHARRVITYNDLQDHFVHTGGGRTLRVPGGYDPSLFPQQPFRDDDNTIRIGMPGRIDDLNKGYPLVRKVFSRILEHDLKQDVQIHLTGESSQWFPEVPGFHYSGWFGQAELSGFYAGMDIVVVPSQWQEPFGMVALEGMATGRPVIVSRVGGLQHIVRDGETGFVIDRDDVDAWTNALITLIRSPELRRRMGNAAAADARENYTWDTIVRKYYEPLITRITT